MDTTFYFHYNPLTPTHTLSVLLAYYFLAIYLLLYMHMHMHMHMCMQMYMCILSLQGGFSSPVEAALERARWAKSLEKTRELRGPRGGRKQQIAEQRRLQGVQAADAARLRLGRQTAR